MKYIFSQCKKMFSKEEKKDALDITSALERVDAQVGRAVTRLAER